MLTAGQMMDPFKGGGSKNNNNNNKQHVALLLIGAETKLGRAIRAFHLQPTMGRLLSAILAASQDVQQLTFPIGQHMEYFMRHCVQLPELHILSRSLQLIHLTPCAKFCGAVKADEAALTQTERLTVVNWKQDKVATSNKGNLQLFTYFMDPDLNMPLPDKHESLSWRVKDDEDSDGSQSTMTHSDSNHVSDALIEWDSSDDNLIFKVETCIDFGHPSDNAFDKWDDSLSDNSYFHSASSVVKQKNYMQTAAFFGRNQNELSLDSSDDAAPPVKRRAMNEPLTRRTSASFSRQPAEEPNFINYSLGKVDDKRDSRFKPLESSAKVNLRTAHVNNSVEHSSLESRLLLLQRWLEAPCGSEVAQQMRQEMFELRQQMQSEPQLTSNATSSLLNDARETLILNVSCCKAEAEFGGTTNERKLNKRRLSNIEESESMFPAPLDLQPEKRRCDESSSTWSRFQGLQSADMDLELDNVANESGFLEGTELSSFLEVTLELDEPSPNDSGIGQLIDASLQQEEFKSTPNDLDEKEENVPEEEQRDEEKHVKPAEKHHEAANMSTEFNFGQLKQRVEAVCELQGGLATLADVMANESTCHVGQYLLASLLLVQEQRVTLSTNGSLSQPLKPQQLGLKLSSIP